MAKLSREQKETEYLDAVEQVVGYQLQDWQRKMLLQIRADTLTGKSISKMQIQAQVSRERG